MFPTKFHSEKKTISLNLARRTFNWSRLTASSSSIVSSPLSDRMAFNRVSTSKQPAHARSTTNHIFDIIDDADDELEYTHEELARYFDMTHLYSTDVDDEELLIDDDDDDDADDLRDDGDGDNGEQVLSQKLSQLSTNDDNEYESSCVADKKRRSTTTTTTTCDAEFLPSKKSKYDDEHDIDSTEQDLVPAYLSSVNRAAFKRAMPKSIDAIRMDELQQVAIYTHHIAALQIHKQITMVYRKSGTGQLSELEFACTAVDRRVWPTQVTSTLVALRSPTSTGSVTMHHDEEQHACETLVHQRLQEIDEKIRAYERKRQIVNVTPAVQQSIDDYVERFGVAPLRMKRDLKIALLEYDYRAEIIDRQYQLEHPNTYQVREGANDHSSRSTDHPLRSDGRG